MSITVLKTEIKAQKRAYELLKDNNMATEDELVMIEKLFKLYNIQYVNDMIVSLLELIYRILQLASYIQENNNISNN